MRDPKRIPRILGLLRRYWEQSPDLRLGQIVGNFTPPVHDGKEWWPGNSYNVEDDVIEQELRDALKETT